MPLRNCGNRKQVHGVLATCDGDKQQQENNRIRPMDEIPPFGANRPIYLFGAQKTRAPVLKTEDGQMRQSLSYLKWEAKTSTVKHEPSGDSPNQVISGRKMPLPSLMPKPRRSTLLTKISVAATDLALIFAQRPTMYGPFAMTALSAFLILERSHQQSLPTHFTISRLPGGSLSTPWLGE